jgi:acyl-CoA reductase-like NAD-dependent aldehyde dehydrogenase
MAAASQGPRGVSMELGGKSPLIVFADADISAAVDWIMTGFLWGSGQVCSATSRVLVHPTIRASLLEALLERIKGVKMGDSCSAEMMEFQGPTMGPVVNETQYNKINTYLTDAKEQGLVFACGDEADQATLKGNYSHPLTLLPSFPFPHSLSPSLFPSLSLPLSLTSLTHSCW